MLKDLEPLLEHLCSSGNHDAESAIMRFGHGDCHELTWALHEKYNCKMIAIVGEKSGMPIHSCALIDESTTLDAYGINKLKDTENRYSRLSLMNLGEFGIAKPIDAEWINTFGGMMGDEPDDVIADFAPVVDLLGMTLEKLMSSSPATEEC
jgi:hypothetical protein